jgi:hypothetical protein
MDGAIRIDVFNADGSPRSEGPVTNVLACQYQNALGQIGSYAFTVPAAHERSAILVTGRIIRITRRGEGVVFQGLIDRAETVVASDGSHQLVVSGSSVARELVWANTLLGFELNADTLDDSIDALLSGTGWTRGQTGTSTITASARFDGATIWQALAKLADIFGFHLRENSGTREIDIDEFGTNTSGLTLRAFEAVSPEQDDPLLRPITGLRILAESTDIWNRIIPIGQRAGISGVNITLEDATRSVANGNPYDVDSAIGPDGETYYYIEDAASVAAHGVRTKVLQIKDVVPLGLTGTDAENASNALYDEAVTYLQRHTDSQTAYEVSAVGLKHLVNGSPVVNLGDTISVQFRGVVQDAGGRRLWKNVDADLYLMGYQRTITDAGADEWSLTASTLARHIPTDGSIAVDFMAQLDAVQAAPLPFVVFGDRTMRMDRFGLQFESYNLDGTVAALYFLDRLTGDAPNTYPQAVLAAQELSDLNGNLLIIQRSGATAGDHSYSLLNLSAHRLSPNVGARIVLEVDAMESESSPYSPVGIAITDGGNFGGSIGNPGPSIIAYGPDGERDLLAGGGGWLAFPL